MAAKRELPQLIQALQDGDKTARRLAARRLGWRGNRQAVEPLLAALQDDYWLVRRNAAKALGHIGEAAAVVPLCQALKDKSQGVRRQAAIALGKIGDARAVEPLCRTLRDKKQAVRENAMESLIQIGLPGVGPLCRLLSAQNETACRLAEKALGQMHYSSRIYRKEELRLGSVPLTILKESHLTPQQRHLGLEAVRRARPGFWVPDLIGELSQFCKWAVRITGDAQVRAGAQELLDYITLGRASQRDLSSEKDRLLRAAHGATTLDGANSLLRASDREEETPQAAPTFLEKRDVEGGPVWRFPQRFLIFWKRLLRRQRTGE